MTETALRYEPSMERQAPDEAETISGLSETIRSIGDTTYKNSGHGLRGVHAKSHGLLSGELEVFSDLPEQLAQGLFARPGRYEVAMRYSTNPGDVLDDGVSTPRGLAVKVIGVEGERLPGSEGAATQDFVMANSPAFAAPDPKAFLKNLKLLAATTDTPQIFKKIISAIMRAVEAIAETFGRKITTAIALGGQPLTHILGDSFFSQAPLLWGPYVAKVSVAPASPELRELTGARVAVIGRPDGHREAINAFFARNGGEWDVKAQLLTDREAMPVEDASVAWPESKSPYVVIGRIRVPPQTGWSAEKAKTFDDALFFSPWHGLAAHRPLGAIMRVRKAVYEGSATRRFERNGCPLHEPTKIVGAPAS